MQDDNEHDQAPIESVVVEEIAAPEAVIHLARDASGRVVMAGLFASEYDPAGNPVHALMEVVNQEFDYLMSKVHGRYTDSDRFRALRDFAVLANKDKARFDVVNGMLQQFEDSKNLADEAARTEADFVTIANFLCHAMIETTPEVLTEADVERIKAAEEKRERRAHKFQLRDRHGNVLN